KGYFPPNNASGGLASAASINGTYVTSVTTASGLTTALFNATNANKAIQGKNLMLSAITAANGGSVQYKCKSITNVVPDRYLPTSCRA
ncbi:MAG: prepilin-type cleavage/methylation domain-containing protein, partial [Gammaproteobacteria bacterium]